MSSETYLPGEKLLALAEVCRVLPKKPSPSTTWRWRTTGVKVNGRTIKLECVRVGGRWFTTSAAWADFLRQQTEAALSRPSDDLPAERTADEERRLQSEGLI
jgi:hypothetical protein